MKNIKLSLMFEWIINFSGVAYVKQSWRCEKVSFLSDSLEAHKEKIWKH